MPVSHSALVNYPYVRSHVTMEMLLDWYGLTLVEKRGKYYGVCPIHDGHNKTQFVVTPPSMWHCFGNCAQDPRFNNGGGNTIDFVRGMEGHDSGDRNQDAYAAARDMIEWFDLGDAAFLPSDHFKQPSKTRRPAKRTPKKDESEERAREAKAPEPDETIANEPLERNGAWYQDRNYDHWYLLITRRLMSTTTRYFGLGYYEGRGKMMQNRIAIPIHNADGEIVAYCGRWAGEPPDGTPKYMLPTGFRKSIELYNFHRVPDSAQAVILAEGYFDVHRLCQQGFENVVSPMGSSLSECQIGMLRDRFESVSIFFDGDPTGRDATMTVAQQLMPHMQVKIIMCPEGKQPEDLTSDELGALIV